MPKDGHKPGRMDAGREGSHFRHLFEKVPEVRSRSQAWMPRRAGWVWVHQPTLALREGTYTCSEPVEPQVLSLGSTAGGSVPPRKRTIPA